jgi:excisionase family DNA binding protein
MIETHSQARRTAITGQVPSLPGDVQTDRFTLPPVVLNLEEVARILRCHPKTVRLMAKAGKIPARRAGSLWRFSAARVYEWMHSMEAA